MRHIEEHMQEACVKWFDYQFPHVRKYLIHAPNGGKRDSREAARFKRMGVRAGVPDLILLLPSGSHPFLGIELKTAKGVQTEYQKEYQRMFEHIGARYAVVRSLDEFINTVMEYINL